MKEKIKNKTLEELIKEMEIMNCEEMIISNYMYEITIIKKLKEIKK